MNHLAVVLANLLGVMFITTEQPIAASICYSTALLIYSLTNLVDRIIKNTHQSPD